MPERSHIVVLPGGGYGRLSDHEGEPVAEWLRSIGAESSVHRYPVLSRHPAPLDSLRARVAELRAGGVDRVAVLGFSAGGHLAGHAAVTGMVDAAVLCYPVVSMLTPTHGGSRQNLIGKPAWPWVRAALSLERLVRPTTPPMFIWHTADDASVPVQHSYRLALALERAGVAHAVHVYPTGVHGLGLATGSGLAEQWPAECEAWLRDGGWLS